MRKFSAIFPVLCFGLLVAFTSHAEEIQTAKVYRDYPGYINPAVCENPNLDKLTAPDPSVGQPHGEVSSGAPKSKSTSPANGTEKHRQTSSALHSANSGERAGHYLAAWAGGVATRDININHTVDMSTDNGYGLGLAIGYDFGPIRLEVEGSYRRNNGDKFRTSGVDSDAKDDLQVETVLANCYADFDTGSPVTPYMGVGVGYARAKVDNLRDSAGVGQLAAGILMAVTPEVALDLGYRYLLPVSHSDFDLRQHTAMIGLQIRF